VPAPIGIVPSLRRRPDGNDALARPGMLFAVGGLILICCRSFPVLDMKAPVVALWPA